MGLSKITVAVVVAMSLSACDAEFAVDTPLDVTVDAFVLQAGSAVVGEVIYPDGEITVTLGRQPAAPVDADDAQASFPEEVQSCEYDTSSHRFSCPTSGLPLSRYVVAVTDAAQPGEGTQTAGVVLTSIVGYDPRVGEFGSGAEGYVFADRGGGTDIPLTGWTPGGRVRVEVRSTGDTLRVRKVIELDTDGRAVFHFPGRLRSGQLRIFVTDGLWEVTYPVTWL